MKNNLKKTIALILASVMIVAATSCYSVFSAFAANENAPVRGDEDSVSETLNDDSEETSETTEEASSEHVASGEDIDSLFACGDVNRDEVIDVRDVTYLQKVIAKVIDIESLPARFEKLADVNRDDVVDVRDVTFIQWFLVGYCSSLPYSPEEETTAPATTVPESTSSTDASGWNNTVIKP